MHFPWGGHGRAPRRGHPRDDLRYLQRLEARARWGGRGIKMELYEPSRRSKTLGAEQAT